MFGGNIFNTAGYATWNRVITLIMTASCQMTNGYQNEIHCRMKALCSPALLDATELRPVFRNSLGNYYSLYGVCL